MRAKSYLKAATIGCFGLLTLAATTTNARAEGPKFPDNLYLTASVGQSTMDMDDLTGFSVDDDDTSYSIGLGFDFNRYLALEAGYIDLGEVSASISGSFTGTYQGSPISATGTLSTAADSYGFYLGPQLNIPATDALDFYIKAGYLAWDMEATATASGTMTYDNIVYAGDVTATVDDDGYNPYMGFGLSFDVSNTWAIKADWVRYVDVGDTDIDVVAAGVTWKFGKLR